MLLALLCVTVGYAALRAVKCPERTAIVLAIGAAILVRVLFPALTVGLWGWGVLAVFLVQYWLGPILVYGAPGTAVKPPVEVFDSRRHSVPESVEEPRQSLLNSLR